MSKNTIILIVIIAVLAVSVGIFAFINAGDLEQKKELEANSEFKISMGEEEYLVTMDDMKEIGLKDFQATKDTSYTDPTQITYTGVQFKLICEHLGIDLSKATDVEFKALDGYSSAVAISDVLDDESIYITVAEDGKALGTKSDGGDGPYMMITASSKFSQSWCKYLEIAIIR